MQNEVKNGLIFMDWDGTLSQGRFWSSLAVETYQAIQKSLFENNKPLVIEWMLGRKNSEQICQWLANELGTDKETLRTGLSESCERMGLSPELRRLLARARRTHQIVLVSDNMDCFTRFTVPANSLENIFDHLVNSADVGRLKNDDNGFTFTATLTQLGVSISHSFLIDDSPKTCALFEKLGGRAFRTMGVQDTEKLLHSFAGDH